jgi:hypothetical protein
MNGTTLKRRRWPTIVVLAAAALVIGAVFGVPGSGRAASASVPANTTPPAISGTARSGSTLTTDNGTWSGTPTGYAYEWRRCDQSGNTCAAIAGATTQSYQVQQADVGSTLRAAVTATNADGSAQATSSSTAVVTASSSAPANTAAPTISGTAQAGSTLTAANGTWTNTPTSYTYAWSRCDQNGSSCSTISGATGQTFQLQQVDVGSTLRVAVTATNASGSAQATSVPTAVVAGATQPVSNGCPTGTGTGTIAIADLSSPARLAIGQQTMTPGLVTPSATTLQAHFRVTACGGRPVQGALVYAAAVPYNQYSVPPEGTTGSDGTVNLAMSQRSGFPAARHQRLLVVFARARKPGDPLTGGISTRLLVSFRVSLR